MNKNALMLASLLATTISLDCEEALATPNTCRDETCFAGQIADCDAGANYLTAAIAGAQVRYSIIGPLDGRCDLVMAYTQHPNPEWVGTPLMFSIDPNGDIDTQVKSAVAGCLAGSGEQWLCGGPLFELAAGIAEETAETVATPVAAGPPCGMDVVDEGPPLYPMPDNGRWGYVTRDGEWAIEPRWLRAEPFSEGRAAVNNNGRWGIIDREGRYVLAPVLRSSTYGSPLQPFSQGCATANIQKDGHPHAFFVGRDGQYWLHDGRPAAISDLDIWEFGDFSGSRAWFRAMGENLQDSFGWIDQAGEMILANDFSGAGEFVDGRAPAAKNGKYSWAYIDLQGNLVLPAKWKFAGARPFSEGLAAAKIDVFQWFYFNIEGAIVIDRVKLKVIREWGGNMLNEVEIAAAGDFHDGLAPVNPAKISYDEPLIYIRPDGSEAFAPGSDLGVTVCSFHSLPEFRNGLVQLLITDKGEKCNGVEEENELFKAGKARYVYLDTSGNIVLRQKG
jgi:hypothetical protein